MAPEKYDEKKIRETEEAFVKIWPKIVAKAWSDESFKKRLLNHPHEVFKEYGIDVPPHLTIQLHENKKDSVHLVLPQHNPKNISNTHLTKVSAAGDYPCFIC